MKNLLLGLFLMNSISAFGYEPNANEIRAFVNRGVISGIHQFIDIRVGDPIRKLKPGVDVFCRECPDTGMQCPQPQYQNGDELINLIPGEVQLFKDGVMIRCQK